MALSEVSSISSPVAFRGGSTPQDWVGFEHKFGLNSREIDLTRSFPGPTGVLYGFIKPNKILEGAKRQVAIDTWWNLFRKWEMCTFENYFEGMVLLRIFWNHIKGHTICLAESDFFFRYQNLTKRLKLLELLQTCFSPGRMSPKQKGWHTKPAINGTPSGQSLWLETATPF